MKQPSRMLLAVSALLLLATGLLAGWAAARFLAIPKDVATIALYDDWRVACPAASQKNSTCQLDRQIIDGKTGSRVASLSFARSATGSALVVTVPLNVLVGPGLGFGLGTDKPHTYAFLTCTSAGCIAQIPVDAALLEALRKEPQAKLQFASLDQHQMEVSFPMRGFRRADAAAHRGLFW